MSHDEDPLLKKIRALLSKAEDPACTEAEAAAFNDKAAELIAKYGVDQALLANASLVRGVVGDRVIVLKDPYSRQKAGLLVNIAGPMRVRVVFNTGVSRRIKGFQVHMFGFGPDIERTEILLTSLLVQAAIGMAKVRPFESRIWPYDRPSASEVAAFRRDWLAGFGATVRKRLEASEDRAVKTATQEGSVGTDLVLVSRNAAVDSAVTQFYPKLRSVPRRSIRNSDAFSYGSQAGAKADLGGTRVAAGARVAVGRST